MLFPVERERERERVHSFDLSHSSLLAVNSRSLGGSPDFGMCSGQKVREREREKSF